MRALAFPLLLLVSIGTASAQGAIHRCMDANGNPVFTDRTCASLHATPVAPGTGVPAPIGVPPMPPATLCAATLPALKQAVLDAFASRDPNRLAGLMLWGGYGHHAVVADIRALGQWMRQPLLGLHVAGDDEDDSGTGDDTPAPPASAANGLSGAAPPALVLSTAGDAGGPPRESTFGVVARAGCLWLRPPG